MNLRIRRHGKVLVCGLKHVARTSVEKRGKRLRVVVPRDAEGGKEVREPGGCVRCVEGDGAQYVAEGRREAPRELGHAPF